MSQPRRSKHEYLPNLEALESLNLLSTLAAGLSPRSLHLRPPGDCAEARAGITAVALPRATPHAGASSGTSTAHAVRLTSPVTAQSTSVAATATTTKPTSSTKSYDYYIYGNPNGVVVSTEPGLLLQGGGTKSSVADGINWMNEKAGQGDWVVFEATGDNADAVAIYDTCTNKPNSVDTIVTKTRDAAYDWFVIDTVEHAEGIFIAGGDQWDYVNLWKGTPLAAAINDVAQRAPVGGNSAGLAVMGQFVFSAEQNTVTSTEALKNPYDSRVTLDRDFLQLPNMGGVITDSHLVQRDRMGRLVTFLARLAQDGWAGQPRGIGVDYETAVEVEPKTGRATVVGSAPFSAAFFLEPTASSLLVCQPKTALTYTNLSVVRLTPGETFNLNTWSSHDGLDYSLSADNGILTSSLGAGRIYG